MSCIVLVDSVAQTFKGNCHKKSVILISSKSISSATYWYPNANNRDVSSERDSCYSCNIAPIYIVFWFKAGIILNLPNDLSLTSLTLKNNVGCISMKLVYTWVNRNMTNSNK